MGYLLEGRVCRVCVLTIHVYELNPLLSMALYPPLPPSRAPGLEPPFHAANVLLRLARGERRFFLLSTS